MDTATPALSPRFSEALTFATDLHNHQTRKGSKIPYVSHLLGVTSLVLEHGGNEDEAIAALLHDAIEDQARHNGGAEALRAEIGERFGSEVLDIVEGCTDTDIHPKPPWRARKEAYIAHLVTAPEAVLRVSCADKLHNARTLLLDYREQGEALWDRFNAGRDETLWFYTSLIEIFRSADSLLGMAVELERTVAELSELSQRAS